MVKVFVALDESGILVYKVRYKTKAKDKYVNIWNQLRGSIRWRYK